MVTDKHEDSVKLVLAQLPLPDVLIRRSSMQSYQTKFTGKILERGFWIYLWKIQESGKVAWYVGRTGDTPSPNAASPFRRLSQHLDLRHSASAAMLANNIRAEGMTPEKCEFFFLAVGPFFSEQASFESHKPYRDIVALLEAELAHELRERGLQVLGKHPRRGSYNHDLYAKLIKEVDAFILNVN